MRSGRSAQRHVVLRRLANQRPVYSIGIIDSETVYFLIQDHHLIVSCRPYLFVKCGVLCLFVTCVLVLVASRRCTTVQVAPPAIGKILTTAFFLTLFRLLCRAFSFADVDTHEWWHVSA